MEVSIAFGGGGSRGAAHIGVLRVLERSNIQIRAVAGTSIGSIVAAFYASGYSPDEIEEIFSNVDQSKLYGWPHFDGPGLLGVHGIHSFLYKYLGNANFDELKLPCAAVAVDLNSNREIILQNGSVLDAILGSIAVPGLFPPKVLGGYNLIDGGILDPVPVCAARSLRPGLPVIAVTLMPPLDIPSTPLGIVGLPVSNPFTQHIARMNIAQAFKIFSNSVDITSRQIAELRLKLDDPELIVRPDVNGINLLDKINVHEIVLRGEVAADAVVPTLKKGLSLSANLTRRMRRYFQSF